MRSFGKFIGRALLVLAMLLGLAFALDPLPKVDTNIAFDPTTLPTDLDAYLALAEAAVPGITEGTQKRIVWHGEKGAKTAWSVVYLHGYSATSEEIRPVPDQVAAALGANLFFTRLTGHGLPGADLAKATPGAWLEDTAEALAIARRLGDRVLVLSTSTGGTLAAFAAVDAAMAQNVAGIVFVAPNFGVSKTAALILNLPFAPVWGPVLAGAERSWTPRNELQARYWTTTYPTAAVFPMRDLVNASLKLDFANVAIPALFYYSDADQVVNPAETDKIVLRWGGPMTVARPALGPDDDAMSHVIAGDILSPGQTAATTARILDWVKGL